MVKNLQEKKPRVLNTAAQIEEFINNELQLQENGSMRLHSIGPIGVASNLTPPIPRNHKLDSTTPPLTSSPSTDACLQTSRLTPSFNARLWTSRPTPSYIARHWSLTYSRHDPPSAPSDLLRIFKCLMTTS